MTPNCGILSSVCVPVGTPKSAVLGFILTRKHASKYKNCFSLSFLLWHSNWTSSLVWLKYKIVKTYDHQGSRWLATPATWSAVHFFLVLLLPAWCWLMDLHIYIFDLCFLQSNSIVHSVILQYLTCHNFVCVWARTSVSPPLIHLHGFGFASMPTVEY
jgi:hypothetical protein